MSSFFFFNHLHIHVNVNLLKHILFINLISNYLTNKENRLIHTIA